jgi:hypothetical protein
MPSARDDEDPSWHSNAPLPTENSVNLATLLPGFKPGVYPTIQNPEIHSALRNIPETFEVALLRGLRLSL